MSYADQSEDMPKLMTERDELKNQLYLLEKRFHHAIALLYVFEQVDCATCHRAKVAKDMREQLKVEIEE